MPMKFVKAQPALAPPVQSVRYFLHKTMVGYDGGRSLANIHASDVTNPSKTFCARERVIAKLKGITKTKDEWLSTSLAMTFAIGRSVQDMVVNTLGKSGVGYADWVCEICGAHYGMVQYPTVCAECKQQHSLRYRERRFVSSITKISCGVDAFAKLSGAHNQLTPIEIKTIDKEEFKKLAMPLAEHRTRMKLYLKIMAESTDKDIPIIDLSRGVLLYVSKGGYGVQDEAVKTWKLGDIGFSPFKEYTITRDDDALAEDEGRVMEYHKAMENKTFPDRICPTPSDGRAYKCVCKAECFSGNYPVGATWA